MKTFNDFGCGITVNDLSAKKTIEKTIEKLPKTPLEEIIADKKWKEITRALKTKKSRAEVIEAVLAQDDQETLEFVFTHASIGWDDALNQIMPAADENPKIFFHPKALLFLLKKFEENLIVSPSLCQNSVREGLEHSIQRAKDTLKISGINEAQVYYQLNIMAEKTKYLNEEMYSRHSGAQATYKTTKTWSDQELALGLFMEILISCPPSKNSEDLLDVIKEVYPRVFQGIKNDPIVVFGFLKESASDDKNPSSIVKMAQFFEEADWVAVFNKLLDVAFRHHSQFASVTPEKMQIILSNEKIQEKYKQYCALTKEKLAQRLDSTKFFFPKDEYTLSDLALVFETHCPEEIKQRFDTKQGQERFFEVCAKNVCGFFVHTPLFQKTQTISKKDLVSPETALCLEMSTQLLGREIPSPPFETLAHFFMSDTNRALSIMSAQPSQTTIDFCLSNESIATSIFQSATIENFIAMLALPDVKNWRSSDGENAGEIFVKASNIHGLTPLNALYKACPEWFDGGEILKEFRENGMSDKTLATFEKQTMRRTLRKDESINSVMSKKSKKSGRLI